MLKYLVAALLVGIAPMATAQVVAERPDAPESVLADLRAQGRLDQVRMWPVDWNGDGSEDLLVQASFVLGGNAVTLLHQIYLADGGTYIADDALNLTGGVRSVTRVPRGYYVSLHVMQSGDARCCPSGERVVALRP